MQNRKTLKMRYNFEEVASMLDTTAKTLRKEIKLNPELYSRLVKMGYGTVHKKLLKNHVIALFEYFGYPEGFEHYENPNTTDDEK